MQNQPPVPQDDLGHNLGDADIVCVVVTERRREVRKCEVDEYREPREFRGGFVCQRPEVQAG